MNYLIRDMYRFMFLYNDLETVEIALKAIEELRRIFKTDSLDKTRDFINKYKNK